MRWRKPPEPEFFPDARRPRAELRRFDNYYGLPVIIVYRPRSRDVRDPNHIPIRCIILGTLRNPPRVIVEVRGEVFKLPLDRVASVTVDLNTE